MVGYLGDGFHDRSDRAGQSFVVSEPISHQSVNAKNPWAFQLGFCRRDVFYRLAVRDYFGNEVMGMGEKSTIS